MVNKLKIGFLYQIEEVDVWGSFKCLGMFLQTRKDGNFVGKVFLTFFGIEIFITKEKGHLNNLLTIEEVT